jgi:hypothetical protein
MTAAERGGIRMGKVEMRVEHKQRWKLVTRWVAGPKGVTLS